MTECPTVEFGDDHPVQTVLHERTDGGSRGPQWQPIDRLQQRDQIRAPRYDQAASIVWLSTAMIGSGQAGGHRPAHPGQYRGGRP